jgi:TolB protein
VWTDDRNGDSDIYTYDLSTKKESRITASGVEHYAGSPGIYGNRIVWVDWIREYSSDPNYDPDAYFDVYMYDFSTKKTTRIDSKYGEAHSPAIYGNNIVWFEGAPGPFDVYMYDISTKKKTQIKTAVDSSDNLDIYGNKIVYQDYRNGNSDIYMYDLSTKKETQITTNKSDQNNPAIYGNTIVWQDNRNGNWNNWDIYAYDLKTRQQIYRSSIFI